MKYKEEKSNNSKNHTNLLLNKFMHQSPLATQIHTLDGKIIHLNPAFIELYGICDEIQDEFLEKYNLLQDSQVFELGFKSYLERAFAGELVTFPEYKYEINKTLTALGIKNCKPKECWVKTQGYPIKDDDGKVTHVTFISEDITDKKSAEQELQDSRLFTDNLIKSANMMIIGIDEEGKVNIFNPAAEELTGYTFEEIKNKDWFEILVPKDRFPEVHEEFKRLLARGIPKSFENQIITKYGDERVISWTNNEIVRNDNYSGSISFGVDITNQKKAENQILQSEAKFRSLFYEAGYAMSMTKGEKGEIVEVNWNWMKLFGYDHPNEVIGTSVVNYVVQEDKELVGDRAIKISKGRYVNPKGSFKGLRKDKTTFLMEVKMTRFEMDGEVVTLAIIIDVTDREKAEEERNRVIDLSSDLISIIDFKGVIKQTNPAWKQIIGYEKEELVEQLVLNFIHPNDVQKTINEIGKLSLGVKTVNFENRYKHKDGSIKYISWKATPIVEEDSIYATGRDVTENKLAEFALMESEEKYRNLIEHLTDGVILIQDDIVKFANQAICDLTGYTQKELLGKEFIEFINLDELPTIIDKYNERDLDENTVPYEIQLMMKNGYRVHFEFKATPSTYLGKEAVLVLARDISERKKAEQALKESEIKFRLLVEQSPISIQILNPSGYIDQVNNAYKALWGFNEETFQEVLSNYNILEDKEAEKLGVLELIKESFSGKSMVLPIIQYDAKKTVEEITNKISGNKRWIEARLYPIKDSENNLVNMVMIEEDMTEKMLKEREILDYQKRLQNLALELTFAEEKQRKQIATDLHDDVGQLLASSRIQIAAINASLDKETILKKNQDVSKGLLNAIKATRQAIFELSPPQLNQIGLEAALSDWMEEELEIKYGIQTVFNGEYRKYVISKEVRYLLFRCIRELLLNVVKHASATQVILNFSQKEEVLKISVEDNGVGFNFDSNEIESKTAGFGLFSIRERIQNIGGTITIETSKGRGTKITVNLSVKK